MLEFRPNVLNLISYMLVLSTGNTVRQWVILFSHILVPQELMIQQ